jgi:hypothetical protein
MDAILDVFAGHVKDGKKKFYGALPNVFYNQLTAFRGNASMSIATGYFAIRTYAISRGIRISGRLRLSLA